ncbi:MAG: FAD-dependent oxidoreductase [Chloroflexi bacterium]|nr:FAD-dependent oxidoreductase [Chloroflexota bacterium]
MANVVIIGGGLTGLAAAWELERQRIPYTLIEVKKRFGGSIVTERRDGFTLDGSAFLLEKYGDWDFLSELGLEDALIAYGRYRDGELVYFRAGTQTLVDALAAKLTAPIMRRMAVSSLGPLDADRFGVCLENGLMLDARAVIVTAPARFTEHMLYSLDPEIALALLDYRYDPVVRVSLGYRQADLPTLPPLNGFKFVESYTLPERVPADHVLVRVGVRLDEAIKTPEAALDRVKAAIPAPPVVEWAAYWPEGDPLTRYLPEHGAVMDMIESRLPAGVALAGSDYRAKRLDQQIGDGRAAAQQIARYITS